MQDLSGCIAEPCGMEYPAVSYTAVVERMDRADGSSGNGSDDIPDAADLGKEYV